MSFRFGLDRFELQATGPINQFHRQAKDKLLLAQGAHTRTHAYTHTHTHTYARMAVEMPSPAAEYAAEWPLRQAQAGGVKDLKTGRTTQDTAIAAEAARAGTAAAEGAGAGARATSGGLAAAAFSQVKCNRQPSRAGWPSVLSVNILIYTLHLNRPCC